MLGWCLLCIGLCLGYRSGHWFEAGHELRFTFGMLGIVGAGVYGFWIMGPFVSVYYPVCMPKPSKEFGAFTMLMDRLLKVPHAEYNSASGSIESNLPRILGNVGQNQKLLNCLSVLADVSATYLRGGSAVDRCDQVLVRQSASDDVGDHCAEAIRVVHVAPIVEAERLLVQVAEQVERFAR